MKYKRESIFNWVMFPTAMILLTALVATAAGPEDYKTALRAASAELGWSAEVSILDNPVNISDDNGNLIYRGRSYEALLGYTITLKIVENLDPSISRDNQPYIDNSLRGSTGGITERMSNPFAGTVESWRSMQLTGRVDDTDQTTWIFYLGLTASHVVSVYWSYGTHLTPDPNEVQKYIEVLAKHTNLLPKTYVHGELRIVVDRCVDAYGNPQDVAVNIDTRDGRNRLLRNSAETTVRINDISRISVGRRFPLPY